MNTMNRVGFRASTKPENSGNLATTWVPERFRVIGSLLHGSTRCRVGSMSKTDAHRAAHAALMTWGENRARDLEGLGWPACGQLERMRRRAQGDQASTDGSGLSLIEQQTANRGRTLSLERMVADLPDAQRVAVCHRYLASRSPKLIAEITGSPADTVRDRLDRALTAISRGLCAIRPVHPNRL